MAPYGGPIKCDVRIETDPQLLLTWRSVEPQGNHDPPRWCYWGDESLDGPVVKGTIENGAAVIKTHTRYLMGTSNFINYTCRIPKLNETFKLSLRFNLVRGNGPPTRTSFEWAWADEKAKRYFKIEEGKDELFSDGWLVQRTAKISLSEVLSIRLLHQDSPALPFINSMSVMPLLPLYTMDNNVRKCSFDSTGMEIWSKSRVTGPPRIPVAVARNTSFLNFAIQNPRPGLIRQSFVLLGTFKAKNSWSTSAWQSRTIRITVDPNAASTSVSPEMDHPYEYLPSGFEGHIDWVVGLTSDPDFTIPLTKFQTHIEFYCLPSTVPEYILDGLPAKLLRILLQTRYDKTDRIKYKDSYEGWVEYCMVFLRSQNFRYETLHGKYNYCDFPGSKGVATQCYLEHWLSHYDTLRNEHIKARQRRVNCYDLATLGQVFLAVGLDKSKHELKMKFLSPYGMIKPTRLIGFDETECNNPFFADAKKGSRWDPNPMWEKGSKLYRSGFGDHAFLAVVVNGEEKVIDATCGPAIAKENMAEYIKSAIDTEASDTLKDDDGKLLSPAGTKGKVRTVPGVSRLVSPVDVQQYPDYDPPKIGLAQAINSAATPSGDIFPAGQLLAGPLHTDGSALYLNWDFYPANGENLATIDITVYQSIGAMQELEYYNREAQFKEAGGRDSAKLQSITSLYDDGKHPLVKRGTMRVDEEATQPFAVWQHGPHKAESYGMVVVVKGFEAEETKRLVRGLIKILDADLENLRETGGNLRVVCHAEDGTPMKHAPSLAKKEGEFFDFMTSCTVHNSEGEEIQIIGADVSTAEGNVVYLEPEFTPGSKSLKFKFQARSAGDDLIKITYLTTHLHQPSLSIDVTVEEGDTADAP